MYRDLWADPVGSTLGSFQHTNDPMQMMWFLEWTPWQLLHGHSPFTSDALFYPSGVSLAWNTLAPTLGVLAAPITLTLGAPLGFAVLMTLAPALTALTGFWWLRRHVQHPAPAVAGGLLLGFDPFMGGHLLGHLNLVFCALLPVMLMLGEDLLWRRPRSQRRSALYLGLVTAAALGISEELVLITVIGMVVALLLALWVLPVLTRAAIATSWRWVLLAVGVTIVAASPLLVSQLLLSPALTVPTDRFRAVPGDYVFGSSRLLIAADPGHRSFLGVAEDGVYLGWAVLAVLLIGILLTIGRDQLVRIASGTLLVMVLFTFGTNGIAGSWLPWRLLGRLPALESVLPGRFAFASFLAIAWLVARWGDQLLTVTGRTAGIHRIASGTAVVGMVAALLTLLPTAVGSYRLPAPATFFGSVQERALLPAGTPVLLLPAGDARTMFYQQQADFRFRQPGGYALRPNGSPAADAPGALLVQLADDTRQTVWNRPAGTVVKAGRQALCTLGLRAIIVVRSVDEAPRLIDLAGALTGRRADLVDGGVSVWMLAPDDC